MRTRNVLAEQNNKDCRKVGRMRAESENLSHMKLTYEIYFSAVVFISIKERETVTVTKLKAHTLPGELFCLFLQISI